MVEERKLANGENGDLEVINKQGWIMIEFYGEAEKNDSLLVVQVPKHGLLPLHLSLSSSHPLSLYPFPLALFSLNLFSLFFQLIYPYPTSMKTFSSILVNSSLSNILL